MGDQDIWGSAEELGFVTVSWVLDPGLIAPIRGGTPHSSYDGWPFRLAIEGGEGVRRKSVLRKLVGLGTWVVLTEWYLVDGDREVRAKPVHLSRWAAKALDEVRREKRNGMRRTGETRSAKELKGVRWRVIRNWENLPSKQKRTT